MRRIAAFAALLLLASAIAAGEAPTTAAEAAPRPASSVAPATSAAPTSAAPTTAAPTPETNGGRAILRKNLWQTLRGGGALMYPIMLCSLIFVAFTIERLVALRRSAVAPKALADGVLEAVRAGTSAKALELCSEGASSMARVLTSGLELAGSSRDDVVGAMEEAGERELWNLDRFAKPLNIIAGVAPLLGLLGTVWGMILAFDVVAQKGALGDPKELAAGIATALLTTLAGLSVAIPSYVFYHYFRSRSDRLIIEIEETASHVAAALTRSSDHANPSPTGGGRGAAHDAAD